MKIDLSVLAATTGGNSNAVVILPAHQADVSAAYSMQDLATRGWYVYRTLTVTGMGGGRAHGQSMSLILTR